MTNSFFCMQKDSEKDNGHLLVFVLNGNRTVSVKTVHKTDGTQWLKGCCWNSQKVFVQFSVERVQSQKVDPEAKRHGKLSIHYAADLETIETVFRIIVSANQLSLYGTVAETCEEYEIFHERTERLFVMRQSSSSLVLSVIKPKVPFVCDDPENQKNFLQQYGERFEKLSQLDKLNKFCMDAGYLNFVEMGQFFMTKDTADFSQFHAVACREYILPKTSKRMDPREYKNLARIGSCNQLLAW